MSVRDDFIAFCEAMYERPLTAQQRALVEALIANPQGLVVLHTARQGSRKFIRELHERFMQGRRADLLIIDDVASSTEAATLPVENVMSNEAEHSPATPPPKPRTQPYYVCDGFGSRASDEAYMMMHTEPYPFCKGTGKLDMGRTVTPAKTP